MFIEKMESFLGLYTKSIFLRESFLISLGVLFLIALSKISIPLPFTPVPLTGQTLGIFILAAVWGKGRGASSLLSYLSLGALGVPVFAGPKVGLAVFMGPTVGYLLGFVVVLPLLGKLLENVKTKSGTKAFLQYFVLFLLATALILFFGALGLSFFIPITKVMALGVSPFIPGGIIKSLVAAGFCGRYYSYTKSI